MSESPCVQKAELQNVLCTSDSEYISSLQSLSKHSVSALCFGKAAK